jgi:hypothetical protein
VAEAEWVDINAIKPWDKNPRKNSAAIKEVAGSIKRFGFSSPIIARRADSVIIAGHTRWAAAQSLGLDKVLVRFMDLDPAQAKALALADNKLGELAEWDEALLAEALQGLDEELFDLSGLGFSDAEIDKYIDGISDDDGEVGADPINTGPAPKAEVVTPASQGPAGPAVDVPNPADVIEDNPYTRKVKAPTYTPKGNRPETSELFDQGKTSALIAEIERANLPPDVRAFMIAAAHRHTVFKYRQIAEFYCHADPALQDLMERSALVIIDFDKAIENGFVHLSERLGQLADRSAADAS